MASVSEARVATVAELQAEGILLVEDGNHGECRPRPDEFVPAGVAFIRAADMDAGRVDFDAASHINDRARRRITKGIGAPGDVLLSHKGTVGKVAIVPGDAPPFVCSPQTTFWRTLRPEVLDRGYLYAYLRSRPFHDQLAARAGETDMAPYVSLTSQRGLAVMVPPIGRQRRIAGILGALDDKIELNHRLAERLDGAARAIFHGWFIANPAAAAWPVTSLADVFDVNPSRPLPRTAPAPYLDMANMPTSGPSALGVAMRIPGSGARFENGDTLLARITPCLENGKTALVDFLPPGERGWGSTEYIVLRPHQPLPEPFAYCLARQPEFVAYAVARMNGSSGRQRVSAAAIREFEIRTPPPELATRFGNVVRPMFDRIAGARRESRTLVALRDALLPRLLSGEKSPSFGRGQVA